MDAWLLIAAACVFFGGVFAYVLFMVFLPEWVGITGKKAKDAEASHSSGTTGGADFLVGLQGDHGRIDRSKKTDPPGDE